MNIPSARHLLVRMAACLGLLGAAALAQAQAHSGSIVTIGTARPPNVTYNALAEDGGSGAASALASYQDANLNPCPACPIGTGPGEEHGWRYYSGSIWASADLAGPASLPVLKGQAQGWINSSTPDDLFSLWAQADAMQVYTYQGPAATKQLQINLQGLLTGVDAGWAGAYLEVLVFDADFVASGGNFDGDVGTMRHVSTGTLGESNLLGASWNYVGYGQTFDSSTISLSLANGDQFAIYARLTVGSDAVSGWGPVEIDASHTAWMGFDDASGLTPQLMAAVPEPASAALLLAGLAGLGAWSARRRRPAAG